MNPKTSAKKLLKKYYSGSLPVDVESIAQKLNIKVIKTEDFPDSVSGMLFVDDNTTFAAINKNHHPHRQRFTIAHEIGHYVLHKNLIEDQPFVDKSFTFYRSSDSIHENYKEEIDANSFAAELLIPENKLSEILSFKRIDIFDEFSIEGLANAFNVSKQAMTIRVNELTSTSIF